MPARFIAVRPLNGLLQARQGRGVQRHLHGDHRNPIAEESGRVLAPDVHRNQDAQPARLEAHARRGQHASDPVGQDRQRRVVHRALAAVGDRLELIPWKRHPGKATNARERPVEWQPGHRRHGRARQRRRLRDGAGQHVSERGGQRCHAVDQRRTGIGDVRTGIPHRLDQKAARRRRPGCPDGRTRHGRRRLRRRDRRRCSSIPRQTRRPPCSGGSSTARPMRPSRSPRITWISHSGRWRSRWRANNRDAHDSSAGSSPGAGERASRTRGATRRRPGRLPTSGWPRPSGAGLTRCV